MGMYTELQFTAEIDYEKHEEIIDILRYMTGDESVKRESLTIPEHELFDTDRWEYMLRTSSYYFPGQPHYVLNEEHELNLVNLSVRTDLKNYGNEIQKFLDWIRPYVLAEDRLRGSDKDAERRMFVGYMRYEAEVDPTIIYFTKDAVKLVEPSVSVLSNTEAE